MKKRGAQKAVLGKEKGRTRRRGESLGRWGPPTLLTHPDKGTPRASVQPRWTRNAAPRERASPQTTKRLKAGSTFCEASSVFLDQPWTCVPHLDKKKLFTHHKTAQLGVDACDRNAREAKQICRGTWDDRLISSDPFRIHLERDERQAVQDYFDSCTGWHRFLHRMASIPAQDGMGKLIGFFSDTLWHHPYRTSEKICSKQLMDG
uniref:Uncharacterized protein n=1 Tax=Pogona vitticeps TaxID=103695 RepID=A0ABM5F5K4_9SAUR